MQGMCADNGDRGGVIEEVYGRERGIDEEGGTETETIKCQVFHEQQRMLCLSEQGGARGTGADRQSERRRVFYAVLHLLAADRMEGEVCWGQFPLPSEAAALHGWTPFAVTFVNQIVAQKPETEVKISLL